MGTTLKNVAWKVLNGKGAIKSFRLSKQEAFLQLICLTLGAYGVRHFFAYFLSGLMISLYSSFSRP